MNEPASSASELPVAEGTDKLGTVWTPETDADRETVRQQLERILASPQFRAGSRGSALLRYIIESALSGRTDLLKERTLGVEVFGREPAYDTNLDPVVRVTASRIRHRIVEYYKDSGHGTEIRILVPPGSYSPVFQLPHGNATSFETFLGAASGADECESVDTVTGSPLEYPVAAAEPAKLRAILTRRKTWLKRAACVSVAALVALAIFLVVRSASPTETDLF